MRKIDKSEISYDGGIENVTFTNLLHIFLVHYSQNAIFVVIRCKNEFLAIPTSSSAAEMHIHSSTVPVDSTNE